MLAVFPALIFVVEEADNPSHHLAGNFFASRLSDRNDFLLRLCSNAAHKAQNSPCHGKTVTVNELLSLQRFSAWRRLR
jgi:hypothetical protein